MQQWSWGTKLKDVSANIGQTEYRERTLRSCGCSMEAQGYSGCKNERQHDGSNSKNCKDSKMSAMVVQSDAVESHLREKDGQDERCMGEV